MNKAVNRKDRTEKVRSFPPFKQMLRIAWALNPTIVVGLMLGIIGWIALGVSIFIAIFGR